MNSYSVPSGKENQARPGNENDEVSRIHAFTVYFKDSLQNSHGKISYIFDSQSQVTVK